MQSYEFWLTACVILFAFGETLSTNKKTIKVVEEHSSVIVDKLLEAYKDKIIASGNEDGEVLLNDFEKQIHLPFPFGTGNIKGSNGLLRNVLSLNRTGPAYVDFYEIPGGMVIRSTLSMGTLNITFDHFHVDYRFVHQNASIEIDVHDCMFSLDIAVLPAPCFAYVRHIRILRFDGFEIRVTGMSSRILSNLVGYVIKRSLKNLSTTNKQTLEDYFYNQVDEAVRFLDVCDTVFSRIKDTMPNTIFI